MRQLLVISLLAFGCFGANAALAAPSLNWRHAIEIPAVEITVTQVAQLELCALLKKYDRRESLVQSRTRGLAVLFFNASANAYRCEVFVLDRDDISTLDHERRHCNGWVHP